MFFKRCKIDDALLTDYLDGHLDQQTRTDIDAHVDRCRTCREKLDQQRSWIELRDASHIARDPDKKLSDWQHMNLNQRIREAVAAQRLSDGAAPVRTVFWKRRAFYYQAAGLTAALVLLVAALPLLQTVLFRADSHLSETTAFSKNAAGAVTDANAAYSPNADDERQASAGQSWTVYQGSLADIPALGMFFSLQGPEDMGDPSEKSTDPGTQETEVATTETRTAGSQDDSDVTDYLDSERFLLNGDGETLVASLQDAVTLRVLVRDSAGSQAMILAAFDRDLVDERAAQLENLRTACQTPCTLEIIEGRDLPSRLELFEDGLYSRIFDPEPEADMTWILIVFGM